MPVASLLPDLSDGTYCFYNTGEHEGCLLLLCLHWGKLGDCFFLIRSNSGIDYTELIEIALVLGWIVVEGLQLRRIFQHDFLVQVNSRLIFLSNQGRILCL